MSFLPMWLLVAALGQAPDAGGWLDAVPAEADVVIRVRGLESTRDDVLAMLKATSPALAEQAGPALEQGIAQMRAQAGDDVVKQPFLVLIRAVKPENPGSPPFAIVVKSPSYEGVLKSISGGQAPALKREEGLDKFDGPGGLAWYAAKGAGTVAIGPDKVLIAAFAKPGEKALGRTVAPGLRKRLFEGDLGLYVNVAALSARYGDEIAQAKQAMMAGLDQAGQNQPATAAAMDIAKSMYGGLFDSIKEDDALVLTIDAAADGLTLDGALTVKADSKAARSSARAHPRDGPGPANQPRDTRVFVYMNLDAKSFESIQKLAIGMMSPGGKPSPEYEAALAKQREQGRIEAATAMTMAPGMRMFSIYNLSDPKALLASSEAMTTALKGMDSPMNVYKDVTLTRNAETYGGFSFTRVEMTIDSEKVAKLTQGNPAQAAQMKAMFTGDKVTTWYGINDKQMLQIMAPSWDQAKAQIDASEKGGGSLGASPGFPAARAKLPKDVNVLVLLSAQGILRQVWAQLGAPAPPDLSKDLALIGASLTTVPGSGFEFRLVIPSAVGPIFEKGMPRAAPGNP